MKNAMQILTKGLGVITLVLLTSGCAINMEVPIKEPTPSKVTYSIKESPSPVTLTFKDEQSEKDKAEIVSGRIPMKLTSEGKPFEGVSWIASHTVNELKARGLPVSLSNDESNSTVVAIKKLHIQNHRATGFSPFVTFTSVRADLITDDGPQRITAYMKRGKVPVWSFDEIIDPTYNDPLATITKELAAKINQRLFGQVVPDGQVNAIIESINAQATTNDNSAYKEVFQLGFSNNPTAIPALVKLTTHSAEYVRLAAISSLGILKAKDQFNLLKSIYESKENVWQDRGMALKAIGDIGGEESEAFLQEEMEKLEKLTDKEAVWNKDIISLYLQ